MSDERIPKSALFSEIVEKAVESEGIFINELHDGDVIEIQITPYTYTMRIIDSGERLVEVNTSNPDIRSPFQANVSGSLLSDFGTSIRLGWIAVGFRLELYLRPFENLYLPRIEAISINGTRIFPAPKSPVM